MKQLIIIVTLFLSLSSCGQSRDKDIESILHGCLTHSYKNQGVDINSELAKLEDYLIEDGSLKSSSGQSYYDFFNQIVEHNDINTTVDNKKFDGVYKLTPSEFYSVDCLEQIKSIDTTAFKKSKYYQMTVEIQKASLNGVTPSRIARAILSVLDPSDFEKPYYRDIALLTIAYTSNTDTGLKRKIPNETKDYRASEEVTIAVTDKNQIILNGKNVSQEELERKLSEFIKRNRANHQIIFQSDNGTSYDFYMAVQEDIKSVYSDLRNDLANEKFDKPYNELPEKEQKEIREVYPMRMTE